MTQATVTAVLGFALPRCQPFEIGVKLGFAVRREAEGADAATGTEVA